jgi:hypothetical protein
LKKTAIIPTRVNRSCEFEATGLVDFCHSWAVLLFPQPKDRLGLPSIQGGNDLNAMAQEVLTNTSFGYQPG